jgi:uncharacterized protein (DUF983 family)
MRTRGAKTLQHPQPAQKKAEPEDMENCPNCASKEFPVTYMRIIRTCEACGHFHETKIGFVGVTTEQK